MLLYSISAVYLHTKKKRCMRLDGNRIFPTYYKFSIELFEENVKPQDENLSVKNWRTAFLKGENHLYMEHQLKDRNTNLCLLWISFYLEDKRRGPDSTNSVYVPETCSSGDLQAANKETKMKWRPEWNLGHLDLHVKHQFCKLLWATLMTLRELTAWNKPKDKPCFFNEQTSDPHGNEVLPNQIFSINLWRTLDYVVKLLSTHCLPPFTMTT